MKRVLILFLFFFYVSFSFNVFVHGEYKGNNKILIIIKTKARFRRRTFHEPNLIPLIKYVKSSASESVKNGCLNLERLSRSSRLAQPGISALERL